MGMKKLSGKHDRKRRAFIHRAVGVILVTLAFWLFQGGGGGADAVTLTTPEVYRQMVSIPAVTITGSNAYLPADGDGVFPDGRTVTLSAYKIARFETIYALWYEVKIWAEAHGYSFGGNIGQEGNAGARGAAPTVTRFEPATDVSWRHAVVWCNAYSAITGKAPVYYHDKNYTAEIKDLSDDTVYVKPGANGYRLPTEAEWETAARGGDPAADAWSYAYAGSDTIATVAWYRSITARTHVVGIKSANSAGLYDMSGNVAEWCYDWYSAVRANGPVTNPTGAATGTYRVYRGGSWYSGAAYCVVSDRRGSYPSFRFAYMGFRVVCAP